MTLKKLISTRILLSKPILNTGLELYLLVIYGSNPAMPIKKVRPVFIDSLPFSLRILQYLHVRDQVAVGYPIKYHSRFFVRVGHETTDAAIGNHHFSLYHVIIRPTKLLRTCI